MAQFRLSPFFIKKQAGFEEWRIGTLWFMKSRRVDGEPIFPTCLAWV
jgi:hypothetical protein